MGGGNLSIKPPKTKASERTVQLSDATVEALREHRKAMLAEGHCSPDAPVFCGPRKGQWLRKADVYRQSFAPTLKRAGMKFRFHDLRHASASLLLAGGVDVKTIQCSRPAVVLMATVAIEWPSAVVPLGRLSDVTGFLGGVSAAAGLPEAIRGGGAKAEKTPATE